MSHDVIAKSLKELGHPVRLDIYKKVIKAGSMGISVGNIRNALGIPNSTLSHHISSLISADLMTQRRDGRTLFCTANYDMREMVIRYLVDECCQDSL